MSAAPKGAGTGDLAIILVTYQSRSLIGDCLRAIDRATAGCPPAIVAVDNASPDGTAGLIAAEHPGVHLIANADNRGFAAACNQGAAETDRPYLLFLNPDTIVLPGALVRALDFLRGRPDVAALGCQLLYADGTFQHSAFRFPTVAMTFLDFFPINHRLADARINGRYPRSAYRQPFPIDHPLGAFLLVRREAFERVGPLDEGYFMYSEEIDWCHRAKDAGLAIYCEPRATVIHHSGASTQQVRAPMLVQLYRSRLRYFAKFCSTAEQAAHRAIIAAGCTARRRTATGDLAAAYATIRHLALTTKVPA